MKLNFIVAMDENGGIGYNNELLCHLPNDLKRFKELTTNNIVVMGRKTFDSLNRPQGLPNRTNIILTRDETLKNVVKKPRASGITTPQTTFCSYANDLSFIIKQHDIWEKGLSPIPFKEVFIIGGSSIYKQAALLENIEEKVYYITQIHNKFDKVDTYFPIIIDDCYLVSEEFHDVDEKHQYAYTFKKYIVK